MTDDAGLRPLYLFLFAAGIGILTLLATRAPVYDTVLLAGPASGPAGAEAVGLSARHR
ncbi:hypothetical protein [Limimaricola cinnabarinus]|jgi:hypothetical protein|uniref:hypothetical protein n=1 Tax=Limimaricola cinnabarinus TaxID=1125964 RepID=UPI0013A62ED4|nr:hypothetical protein [Limimaricola cinnabarinus]